MGSGYGVGGGEWVPTPHSLAWEHSILISRRKILWKAEKLDRPVLINILTNNGNERLAGISATFGTTITNVLINSMEGRKAGKFEIHGFRTLKEVN